MGIVPALSRAAQDIEARGRGREFLQLARCLALGGAGGPLQAVQTAKAQHATDRVVTVLQKSAVAPMSLTNTSDLAEYRLLAEGFIGALRHRSAFETILADGSFRTIPFRTRVGAITQAPNAYRISEGGFKATTRLSVSDGGIFDPIKAVVQYIVSGELLRSSMAVQILERELLPALGAEIDAIAFAEILTSGVPNEVAVTGGTGESALQDIEWLLSQVSTSARSRLYFIGSPSVIKTLACRNASGVLTFPRLGPLGGFILDVPTLVSDGVPTGNLILLDAAQVLAVDDGVGLPQRSGQADVHLDDNPDTETVLTSLWQTDQFAIRAERYFGIMPPAAGGAVAYVTGVA